MEYVALDSSGSIPDGKFPIPAGHDQDKRTLHFAIAEVTMSLEKVAKDIWVPGMWATHFGHVKVAFAEMELQEAKGKVLCWKHRFYSNVIQ